MRLEIRERHELEGGGVRRLEHDRRRGPGLERFLPAGGDDTPAIAWLQAREHPLRLRRDEVVPARHGEREELLGHHRADRVEPEIDALGSAVAIPEVSGHRIEGARLELAAENVHAERLGGQARGV